MRAFPLLVAVAALLSSSQARSAELTPDEAALRAYNVREEHCADLASATDTSSKARRLEEVAPVYADLSEVYDATGEVFLLWWRGVLAQCVEWDQNAIEDFSAFVSDEQARIDYPDMHREARIRLRRMGVSPRDLQRAAGVTTEPRFYIGLGGGVQVLADGEDAFGYAIIAPDLSVRLQGPLLIMGHLRLGLSQPARYVGSGEEVPGRLSVQTLFGVGPALRIGDGPLRGHVAALFQIAPNVGSDSFAHPVAAGAAVSGGVTIPLGDSPLELRPLVEVGFLNDFFSLRGGAQVVLGL